MSGIAGIVALGGPPQEPALIDRLTSAMKHRGPDKAGHWVSDPVSLGHCMLRTTPQSQAEIQPLLDPGRGLALVMDGRLDNREELFARLKPGFERNTAPDAAFVLEAYAQWGEDCPRYLMGSFAFALWDSHRQKLICARDQVGAAGFAYHHGKHFFAFASEPEALLRLPGVSKAPNENYIAHLLVPAFQNDADRRSWQRDVSVLMPGESLTLAPDGTARIQTYWQFEPREERSYASRQECEEHFLTVFGGAVRDRMSNEGDVAAMMSGGLDSAGIVAMVHRLLPEIPGKNLHTYSALDDDPDSCIESRCIQSMAGSLQVSPHFVSVPSFQGMVSVADLVETAWSKAHPVDNSILLPALMCLAASRSGHRVLLTGVCGDLAMRAPLYYPFLLLRKGELWRAWRECRAASRNNVYLLGRSPLSIFMRSAVLAGAPPALLQRVRRARYQRRPCPVENSLINPEFAEKIRLWEQLQEEFNRNQQAQLRDARLAQMQTSLRVVLSGLSGYGRVAGRFGVEVRDPWSDPRVLDFFFRLPPGRKVRNGWTKYPVRTVFRHELAQEVRWRRDKVHLGWKFAYRLMAETHDRVSSIMTQDVGLIEEYVNVKAVRALHDRYFEQGDDASRESVYELATLIVWLRRNKTL